VTSRKHPSAAFLITVALVAVLLYVQSSGPVFWLQNNHVLPYCDSIEYFYKPVVWMAREGPDPIGEAILLYWLVVWHIDVLG